MLAQEEAHLLNHSFIGTEHILLGLIHEGEGLAAKALESLGISLEAVREKVEETIGPAGSAPTGSPPFTPRAKKVLELSLREALQLGHNYIGTEHMLLGLVREGEGVAAQVLQSLGADLPAVRQEVIGLFAGYRDTTEGGSGTVTPMMRTRRIGGVEWPRYPTAVLPGPAVRLGADGIALRVVGVLLFEVGIQVMWELHGIPEPLVALMNDPVMSSGRSPVEEVGIGPGLRRVRVSAGSTLGSFLELTDDAETVYSPSLGAFEPLADGRWAGRSFFTPAAPDAASVLRVRWQGDELAVDL